MDRIQSGDVIAVQYLGRFARTVLEGLQVVEELTNAGIYIKCLRDPIDTSDGSAAARAQRQMSLVFAEWQRNTTRERIVAGQNKARAQGRTPGRKSALRPSQQDAVHHTSSMTRLLCHGIGASAKPGVNLFSPTERKFTHARTQSFAQTAQPRLDGN